MFALFWMFIAKSLYSTEQKGQGAYNSSGFCNFVNDRKNGQRIKVLFGMQSALFIYLHIILPFRFFSLITFVKLLLFFVFAFFNCINFFACHLFWDEGVRSFDQWMSRDSTVSSHHKRFKIHFDWPPTQNNMVPTNDDLYNFVYSV